MTVVGFLHTSEVHVSVFDDLLAAADPDARSVSIVDADALSAARASSPDDPAVIESIVRHVDALAADGATSIICTCSTIGDVAESVGRQRGVRVIRVDRAMADRAVAIGGRIVVLAALESTIGPTRALLLAASAGCGTDAEIDVRLIPDAWGRFESGDQAGYLNAIASAIRVAAIDADVVVLAQASMAPAAELVDVDVPVLASPALAVAAALSP